MYHYTTQDGLLGILTEGSLWATKIHYMNDASELVLPFQIASSILKDLVKQEDAETKREEILDILDDINLSGEVNICVVSFCTYGDLLSQWRGYGFPSSAYSIGFDTRRILENIESQPFQLLHCRYYDKEEYHKKINEFIVEFLKISKEERRGFIGSFIEMAATMKLNCFEEEDEWRIVSSEPISSSENGYNFRIRKSVIIPYFALPVDLSSIVEIVIGPCRHPKLAEDSLWGLKHKFGLENLNSSTLKLSEIPYRVP